MDNKPFSCKYCDKKFSEPNDLYKHDSTHADDKPFSCNHCEKKFTPLSDLKHDLKKEVNEN